MNQILEYLTENYLIVAGVSAGIILILIIIIILGNKKGKKEKTSNEVKPSDIEALKPEKIDVSTPEVAAPVIDAVNNDAFVIPSAVPETPVENSVPEVQATSVEPVASTDTFVVPSVVPEAPTAASAMPEVPVEPAASTDAFVVPSVVPEAPTVASAMPEVSVEPAANTDAFVVPSVVPETPIAAPAVPEVPVADVPAAPVQDENSNNSDLETFGL